MTAVYATLRSQASNVTFAAVSGGSLTGSGTLYFCAQLRSRAGLNLPTTPVSISYTAGQRISVTIASTAISTAEAGSAMEVVISAAATNDVTQMQRLASYSLLQADQITQVTLPQTFYLSQPAHIALAAVVANPATLPTGSSLINGMVRQITSLSANYYKYDATASSGAIAASPGYWVSYYPWIGAGNGFTTYIGTATDNPGGCDFPLQSVGSDALPLPPYNPALGASTPLRIAIQNGLTEDGSNSIEALSPIGLIVEANGVNLSAAFSGAIDVTYLGLARKSTGTLDTADANVGVNKTVTLFAGAANAQQNAQGNNTLSSYATTNLTFPQAVPRGYFALFSVQFNANANQVAQFVNGEDITVYFDDVGDVGEYSALAEAIGDTVLRYSDLPPDGFLRILPAANSIVSQPGLGVFQGYIARRSGSRSASLSVADTAGQKVAIAGTSNGQIIVRQPSEALLPTEALRAKVSTAAGTADATATGVSFSSPISVGASGSINVALTYPAAIRANYPDAIAGTAATFNVPRLKVYLRFGGTITEQTALITCLPGGTQNITITTNTGSTVASLPVNASPAFCLFSAPTKIATAGTGGSLAAGSYEIAVAPHLLSPNTQATAISHKVSDGCVPEILTDLATAIGGAKGYTTLTASFVQPAIGGTVTATVGVTDFFAVLQPVFAAGGGGYTLQSKTSTSLTLLREIDNGASYAATGSTIASDSLVVPGGMNGLTGATGAIAGFRYTFSSATAATPANGSVRLNNATPASATAVYVSESDRLIYNLATALSALTNGSLLLLTSESDATVFHWYTLVSQVDNGSDRTLTVSYLYGGGSFVDGSNVSLTVLGKGGAGAAGADGISGFGTRHTFSTSTSPNPGTNLLRLNASTIGASTAIYVSDTDRFNRGISNLLDTFTVGSLLLLVKESNPTIYGYYTLTAIVDTGADHELTVTYRSGAGSSIFAANDAVSLMPALKGDQGEPGTVEDVADVGLSNVTTAPATATNIIRLFNKVGIFTWRLANNGAERIAAALNVQQTFTAAQGTQTQAFSSSGTIAINGALSNVFRITLASTNNISNPSNLVDGFTYLFVLVQDATGSRTVSWGGNYDFGLDGAPTLTTTADNKDVLSFLSDGTKLYFCGIKKGFS